MKKGLLVCLSLAIGIGAMGQRASRLPQGFRRAEVPASLKYQTVKVTPTKGLDNGVPVNNLQSRQHVPAPATFPTYVNEDVVGYTYYDLQTNGAVSNRLQKNGDGTFSAIWTFSPDANQSPTVFPNRGTGYNYFDGNAWGPLPTARIEPIRTGFTTLGVTQSGAEMTIQHTGSSMSLNRRPVKGTGAWTTSYPWGQTNNDFWPKSAVANDHVYVIFQGTGSSGVNLFGQDGPIFFSKSDDAGVTWTTKSVIDLIDSVYYIGFGGDDYTLDADTNGNVAIVYGETTTDIGLLKSNDFGVTWTKTIIQTFPIPLYNLNNGPTDVNGDGTPDTLNTNAGDAHVMLDNGGRAHVWFTDYRFYSDFSTPGSYNYFPSTDGLFYWNETMPTDGYVFIASAQDYNGNGTLDAPLDATCSQPWGNYRGGLTEMPSSGIDPAGTIYVTYQTVDEAADTAIFHQMHRHIYMITSPDNGVTWTYPFDIVPDSTVGGDGYNQEAVFASMAKTVDASAYVLYQRDYAPGHALAAATTCDLGNNLGNSSDIIFARVESATVAVNGVATNDMFVSQNYPNPSLGTTSINVVLKKTSDINVTITDMLGKTVYSTVQSAQAAGSHVVTLNTSNWNSGIYMYTVIAGGQKTSHQMVVR